MFTRIENIISRQLEKYQTPGKVYIVPTKNGVAFLGTSLIVIAMGAIYTNNTILLLGFILLSIMLTHMFSTHFNLKGLTIQSVKCHSNFINEKLRLDLHLKNHQSNHRSSLNIELRYKNKRSIQLQLEKIHEQNHSSIQLPFTCDHRGMYQVENVILSTRFPMGFFYAWSSIKNNETFYAYPYPKGESITNQEKSNLTNGQLITKRFQQGNFSEHRKYSKTDTVQRVDWKVYAKKNELLVKQYEEAARSTYHLDYFKLSYKSDEERLSQISLWVRDLYSLGESWSMSLPNMSLPVGQGRDHYKESLKILAVYES